MTLVSNIITKKIIQAHYNTASKDCKVELFCGLTLKWNYNKRMVDLRMPGHVEKVLHQLQHQIPTITDNQPYKNVVPKYGANVQ